MSYKPRNTNVYGKGKQSSKRARRMANLGAKKAPSKFDLVRNANPKNWVNTPSTISQPKSSTFNHTATSLLNELNEPSYGSYENKPPKKPVLMRQNYQRASVFVPPPSPKSNIQNLENTKKTSSALVPYKPPTTKASFISKMYASSSSSKTNKRKVNLSYHGGLRNLGNTCYLNAVLQAVLGLHPLMHDLASETWQKTINANVSKVALAPELLRLKYMIDQPQKGDAGQALTTLPREIKRIVAKHSSKFIGNAQEDAHEFLLDLMNLLHEEVHSLRVAMLSHVTVQPPVQLQFNNIKPLSISMTTNNTIVIDNDEVVAVADVDDVADVDVDVEDVAISVSTKEQEGQEERERWMFECLPTTRNMHAEVRVELQCKGCHATHHVTELYRDISVDLPINENEMSSNPISVTDLLSNFFQPEERELKCEKCNHNKFLVSYKFDILPQVLIIHVKRFQYNMKLKKYMKCHKPVVLESNINIQSFCTKQVTDAPMHDLGPTGKIVPLQSNTSMIQSENETSPPTPILQPKADAPIKRRRQNRQESDDKLSRRQKNIASTQIEKSERKRKREGSAWGGQQKTTPTKSISKSTSKSSLALQPSNKKRKSATEQEKKENDDLQKAIAASMESSLLSSTSSFSSSSSLSSVTLKTREEKEELIFQQQMKEAKKASILPTTTASSSSSASVSVLSLTSTSFSNSDVVVVDVSSPSQGSEASNSKSSKSLPISPLPTTATTSEVQFVSKIVDGLQSTNTNYQLTSVVRHSGSDAFAGHYTTDVRQTNQTWSRYDDARVQNKLTMKQVTNGYKNQREAYVLIYVKKEKKDGNSIVDLTH